MPRAGESIRIGEFDVLRPEIAGVRASTVSGLPGWWDTPETRASDQERSGGDGDFPSVRSYGARMVTVAGDVSCESRDALYRFRDRIAGLGGPGGDVLTVEGHGPSQFARVYRSGSMEWSERSPVAASWQLTFKAPDPRKYGLVEHRLQTTSGVSVNLSHEGNYPALPRLNVYSADMPDGYTVYRGTGGVTYTRVFESLTSGMVHSVDFATGVTSVQGTTTTGMLGKARLIQLDPYKQTAVNVVPYGTSATATVAWYWRDTWI